MSSATRSAERRRVLYEARVAAATSDRGRINAVVGWLMAEWYQLPAEERTPATDPLLALARELNERSRS